jgi:hypothetical protein
MSEPRALVEHFFRHEFNRLGAVLTRSLGVRRLALVEDVAKQPAGLPVALSASPLPAKCLCYAGEVEA